MVTFWRIKVDLPQTAGCNFSKSTRTKTFQVWRNVPRYSSFFIFIAILPATSPSWVILSDSSVCFKCFKLQKLYHSVQNKCTQCSLKPFKNYIHILSSLWKRFLWPISASSSKQIRGMFLPQRKKVAKSHSVVQKKGGKNLTSFTGILIVDRLWCGSGLHIVAWINRLQIDRQYHAETG